MKNLKSDRTKKELKRGLSNRHIQLIALGGSIGTGLFLGIGPAAVMAGPSVILRLYHCRIYSIYDYEATGRNGS